MVQEVQVTPAWAHLHPGCGCGLCTSSAQRTRTQILIAGLCLATSIGFGCHNPQMHPQVNARKADEISRAISQVVNLKVPSLSTTSCPSYSLTPKRLKHFTKYLYLSKRSSACGGRWQILVLPWSGTYRRHESGMGAPKLRRGLSFPPSYIQRHHPSAPHPSSGLSRRNTGLCSSARRGTPRVETAAQKERCFSLRAGNTATWGWELSSGEFTRVGLKKADA